MLSITESLNAFSGIVWSFESLSNSILLRYWQLQNEPNPNWATCDGMTKITSPESKNALIQIVLSFESFVISIYALTLSIILSTIYTAVYSLTGFVIEYFNAMYLLIAYIYVIAAILIIKSDIIKQHVELQKIYKVEAQVKKELEEQKDKDKDENEENKKENEKKGKDKDEEDDQPVINREPDGSEI